MCVHVSAGAGQEPRKGSMRQGAKGVGEESIRTQVTRKQMGGH